MYLKMYESLFMYRAGYKNESKTISTPAVFAELSFM